ncbi:prefoldin 5-like protein [Leptomonas seymouri]|uniref:Prefoldin 5-like protein n=1 Tax=Leptomonas seymouri TaxID=5684 RepID=A0A0N1IJL6_LEPSE|nr:prefoldin 5-like protein [Leptomonas seymouri]|eukprot:KPI85811.1 prefoldin 5-like protein [Leptomonas seymouri]
MSVNVYQLPIEQLETLKEQLDNDMQSLGTAYDGLYNGRNRYQDNHDVIDQYKVVCESAKKEGTEQEVLVCMTSSLFVRGTVIPSEKVLVDVGTGYFLERSMEHAKKYFTSRAAQIKESMDQVEKTIVIKQHQQNQVIDALQQKTVAMQRYREENGSE